MHMYYCMDSSKKAMELKPTHYNHLLPPSIIFSLLILTSITTVQSTTPSTSTVDFIKESCNVTRFPDLCFSSLSITYTGGNNLGTLTCAAINVSLAAAEQAADHVAATMNRTTPGSRGGAAVQDCVKLTRDAVRQLRRSLEQMMKVVGGGGGGGGRDERRVRFEISNVQTWMSAGITDQDTCMDGFRDGEDGGGGDGGASGGGEVKIDASGKVGGLMKLISNALSLVNSYAKGN